MDELTLDGKIYISSKRAAAITGYAKDYVGQLCREGRVEARLVGRSWYVLENSIKAHRFGADTISDVKTEVEETTNTPPVESVIDEKPNENEAIFEHRYFQEEINPIKVIEEEPKRVDYEGEHQIVAMQDAWREWFEGNKNSIEEELLIPEDKIIDNSAHSLDNSEDEHKEVSLHIIRDTHQQPEPEVDNITPVARDHIHNDVLAAPTRHAEKENVALREEGAQHPTEESYLLLKAILAGVILVVVSITVISTGIVQSAGVQTSGVFMILSGETKI